MKKFMPQAFIVLAFVLLLQGCSGSDFSNSWETPGPTAQSSTQTATPPAGMDVRSRWEFLGGKTDPALNGQQAQTATPPQPVIPTPAGQKVKVALLVPLTGSSAEIGASISNAAQMALFDTGGDSFELIPRDTHSTSVGAANAARSAIQDGAQLILGPLLADEVRAVAPIVQEANINMIAFTTDWKQAGGNTFVMGFVPFNQVQRVISYAATQNIRSIGVIAPQNEYGNAVMDAYTSQAALSGIQTMDVLRVRPGDPAIAGQIKTFARLDARKQGDGTTAPPSFNAIFMPIGGADAQTIANLLGYNQLDTKTVRRLGTGLWDDATIAREANMAGGWFAAPDPASRKIFEQKYREAYNNSAPSRLASLGYDATALAAVLAKTGQMKQGAPAFDRTSITNPNGFSGIDGIFRFRQDGVGERGLAILEIRGGQSVVIDPAPRTFLSK